MTGLNADHKQMIGANFPLAEDGSTYHLETKLSEVANRILTVGDPARAEKIAKSLDKIVLDKVSHRGFRTITGLYKNVPVSIVAIGMGISAMDFFLRETKAVVDGDMAVIRLGTCGVVKPDIPVGTVVVHDSSVGIIRNPDGFRSLQSFEGDNSDNVKPPPYIVTLPVNASPSLTNILFDKVKETVGEEWTRLGLNATGDSFYSSQGRITDLFFDDNEHLIDSVVERYPNLTTLEMETFHLFDIAECCRKDKIYAGSCVIVLAQRRNEEFLDTATKKIRESQAGLSVLEALTQFPLENEMKEGIWSS